MIFKRKIYDKLREWKENKNGSTALLIKGCRRVGKSTIAEEFAKAEYRSYILIDFAEANPEVKTIFDDMSNIDIFFARLSVYYPVELFKRESLIIFDEVQLCPKARQAIKALVRDGRYDYIETGSLLTLKKNIAGIRLPSEETSVEMLPMDFEEFLWALGDNITYNNIKMYYEAGKPLGDAVVRQLMRTFRMYMLVGGMPQAVRSFIETNNFRLVDETKREIIELYESDFYKIDPTGGISLLFDNIPGILAAGYSKFTPSRMLKGSRNESAARIADLISSLTVNACYHVNDPSAGLGITSDLGKYKLYLADTGLFITLAFKSKQFTDNEIYKKLLSDKLDVNLGYVYENMVAQMLKAAGNNLYYHTFEKEGSTHNYEIDFIIERKAKLCPIEVKSGQSTVHSSLDAFMVKYSSKILTGYLIYPKDFKRDGNTWLLPVFMTGLI